METETLKEKIERFKATAEVLLKLDKPIYIKDVNNNLYFADILLIGDDTILINCFGPEQRKGSNEKIYWVMISKLEEYKDIVRGDEIK